MQLEDFLNYSGTYPWTVEMQSSFTDGATFDFTASGLAPVVVRDSQDPKYVDPYGNGWGIDGISQLVFTCNGVLMVYGSGDARYFARESSTQFASPANDFGTLIENANETFVYTTKDQIKWNFDDHGNLTSVVDPHGLARDYFYDSQGRLIKVETPDGATTTLHS